MFNLFGLNMYFGFRRWEYNAEFSGEEGRSPTDSAGTPGYTSLEKA
jgi:hypothetical protein